MWDQHLHTPPESLDRTGPGEVGARNATLPRSQRPIPRTPLSRARPGTSSDTQKKRVSSAPIMLKCDYFSRLKGSAAFSGNSRASLELSVAAGRPRLLANADGTEVAAGLKSCCDAPGAGDDSRAEEILA